MFLIVDEERGLEGERGVQIANFVKKTLKFI